jgi:predicted metal-binding membrane protein
MNSGEHAMFRSKPVSLNGFTLIAAGLCAAAWAVLIAWHTAPALQHSNLRLAPALNWFVMLVAMMLPRELPAVARISAPGTQPGAGYSGAAWFLAAYVGMWMLYGVLLSLALATWQASTFATPANTLTAFVCLLPSGASVLAHDVAGVDRTQAIVLLLTATLYQFTPLKRAALAHGRATHSTWARPTGFRLGAQHGAWCLASCWALMASMAVSGMHPASMAALGMAMAAERAATRFPVRQVVGFTLAGWALVLIAQ